jgi:hypothetical protein
VTSTNNAYFQHNGNKRIKKKPLIVGLMALS